MASSSPATLHPGYGQWLSQPTQHRLSINLPPIADAQDADDDATILNVADDAPIADAVFPVTTQLRSGECLPNITGIVQCGHTLLQKPD